MRLPNPNEDAIQCGDFSVYTNGSGEVFVSRHNTTIRISSGPFSDEIKITANAALCASFVNNLPAISCRSRRLS